MNEESIQLLQEISAGCRTAADSFEQAEAFVRNQELREVIRVQKKEHTLIGDIAHQLLHQAGADAAGTSSVAKAVMQLTAEVKMMMDPEDRRAAELLADGCHAGIKSLSRYLREYEKAGQKERALAGRLMNLEMDLYKRLLGFL